MYIYIFDDRSYYKRVGNPMSPTDPKGMVCKKHAVDATFGIPNVVNIIKVLAEGRRGSIDLLRLVSHGNSGFTSPSVSIKNRYR